QAVSSYRNGRRITAPRYARRHDRARRSWRYLLSLPPMVASTPLHELWDTTRMRLLVEIERQGSVSGAAAAIGIGQPSASQHLRLLESAAGQRLVERTGRGSRLTEAGQVLAARAAQALSTLGAAEAARGALARLPAG